jgi:hypothetical protein
MPEFQDAVGQFRLLSWPPSPVKRVNGFRETNEVAGLSTFACFVVDEN